MKRYTLLFMFALMAIVPVLAEKTVDLTGSGTGVKEIEMTNKGLAYDIKEIRVNVGDTVRITYTNGGGFHDLVFDDFNVATAQIQARKSETIEFKVVKAGEYEYYCSVGNHRAMGMWGTLIAID